MESAPPNLQVAPLASECEHAFVPGTTEEAMRFQRAIETEDVSAAMASAAKMSYVSLGDSLALVRLLARKCDPRFDRAANRWLNRWVIEKGASVGEVSIATAAMGTLAINPDSQQAIAALRIVLKPD
jgi:hypothetical protein